MFPSTIGTCHIILTCLALMVKLPTSSTCQSVTACPNLLHLKHRRGFGIYGTIGICKYPAFTELGRVGTSNVRIKVFVGTSSLFRRTFIRLTDVTPCEDRFSQISSSLTPSRSRYRITPFEEFRYVCGLSVI